MTENERTTPTTTEADDDGDEGPGRWGVGLTPGGRRVLAEFADWFVRTEAPDLADFVEKALAQVIAGAELTYSLDSGGLLVEFPGTERFETVAIELPDKVTEVLEDVNGDQMGITPSEEEIAGLARTRAMLVRWLELVDARLALPSHEDEP